MQHLKYVVASPGRTGSVFTTLVIAKSLKLNKLFDDRDLINLNSPSILHTHNAHCQVDKNIPVVCVQRKNLFNEVISAVIAEHYQEWNTYTNTGEPFEVDAELFETKYIWHKWWHKAFNHYTDYTNKTYIMFEDFIGNSRYLCNLLNIPIVDFQSCASIRKPSECILNFEHLKEQFDIFENNLEFQSSDITTYNWIDLKKHD
jgi:hypothetical protein